MQHLLTSNPFSPPDLVSFGARRAGKETETEEQAGAGHRHNGADQLRTIEHLLLLLTPPLHLSLSHVPLTQTTNKTPTPKQYDRRNCKRTEAVYCKMGGFGRDGRGLCTLTCVCVCVCLQLHTVCLCERLGHGTFFHTYIHGEHVNSTAFDYCGCRCLWFA